MNHRQVRDFFALNHTRPKKQLGQNFLVNPEVLEIILDAGELTDIDTVIEIGAGLGCLTDALTRRAKRVIAVEVDELLYKALVAQFSANSHVQLLNADILKLEFDLLLADGTETVPTTFMADGTGTVPTTFMADGTELSDGTGTAPTTSKADGTELSDGTETAPTTSKADGTGTARTTSKADGTGTAPTTSKADGTGTVPTTFKVIANLPYSITTPILWKLLDRHKQIHSCVLMMQKEVAERIVAEPGGKDYGALTIGVAYYADATLIATLAPENFYPAPKVDSALLKLTMHQHPKVAVENEELFFKLVRTAFRTRRKMLKNTLVRSRLAPAQVFAAAFEELDIAPERRAETLDITEFAALANFLSEVQGLES